MSLFPLTSSLFGASPISTKSQPASTSSAFGVTATSQLQSTSVPTINIFGTSGTPQPQPQQQSSLFSNFGERSAKSTHFAQSQPPSHANSTTNEGLSAGTGGTQPASSTTFGFPDVATTTQPSGSSLFASQQSQQPGMQNAQGVQIQPDGQQAHSGGRASQPAFFENLLEKGRKRTYDANGGSGFRDLPHLQLGLGDIAKRVREMRDNEGASTQGAKAADSTAHYLLAASGVNPGTTRSDLESLGFQNPTSLKIQQPSDHNLDTHRYVEQLQEQSTLRMISEGLEQAQRNFDAHLEENVDINWELQRKKIYEHFGLTPKGLSDTDIDTDFSGIKGAFGRSGRRGRFTKQLGHSILKTSLFGQAGSEKSVIGTPRKEYDSTSLFTDVADSHSTRIPALDYRFLREKQRKFADKVQTLNQARLSKTSYPILQEFKSVECQSGGESPRQLGDAYDALTEIVVESDAREMQYANDYLDESLGSAGSIKIRRMILGGSRRYLEKAFFEQLQSLVAKNPKDANIGGMPTIINKVRAYIRIRAARRDLIPDGTELRVMNDDYCWALIFFLLRSGFVREATDYVTANKMAFSALDRNFGTYITGYASSPDRRLGRKAQDHVNREYQKRTQVAPENQNDPYQIACYKIIGRCELSRRSVDTISQGVEDWLWLQFSLAREVARVDESAGDSFGLEEVRETIREIGQRHFSQDTESTGDYGTFFFLQILGGLFEQAVSYLYSQSYIAAVHFAIALDYYGLLRVSDFSVSEAELLTYSARQFPQISFGRMLGFYTRDFRTGDVEAAVDYLTLICLNVNLSGEAGEFQSNLCYEALRELVLETREFAQLLGDIRSDGTRLKGVIERRLPLLALSNADELLKAIITQAASVADDAGRTTDAVLLYHLAEDCDNVITIINRALSEAIAVDIGSEQLRLQPLKPITAAQPDQSQQRPSEISSLSLISIDDPLILARTMISLYNGNALYFQKIRPMNREACGLLLRMSEAKAKVGANQWSEAIDIIDSLGLLPLKAHASIPAIRASATAFNALPPTISRNIGPLLLWTITCIGQQRDALGVRQYGSGVEGTNREIDEELLGSARDLMVFAGLVKYRLGEKVWEAVCSLGGDAGVY